MSSNDRLAAIQHAFQRSFAAATTLSSQHKGYQAADTGAQPTEYLTQQHLPSALASTVPETQVFIDIDIPLPSILHATSANIDRLLKKMSTQGSLPQDTQPVSQSIYESILSKVKNGQPPEEGADDADGVDRVENEQDSLQEGDDGHINLLSGYKAQEDELGDDSGSEPGDFSPTPTQHHLSQFPESERFKTPGNSSRKRDYNGQVIETPFLPRNPLARTSAPTPGRMMGLSQAFAATQAISSPLVNGLSSGPVSDRPSPNIELQTRPALATLSSPLRPKSDFRRITTEPYSHYKSIKQSQAERDRLSLFGQLKEVAVGDNVSDDDFDDEPSIVERSRRLKEREEKVRRQLLSVSSANRQRSHESAGLLLSPTRMPQSSSPRTSPRSYVTRTDPIKDNLLSSIAQEEPEIGFANRTHDSEEETEQEDEVEIARSSQMPVRDEEDKENLEFAGLQVPETVARLQGASNNYHGLESSPSVRQSAGSDGKGNEPVESGWVEPFAVANTQPSQSARKSDHPPGIPLTSSADGPSFVPQSQVLANGNQILSSPQRSNLLPFSNNDPPKGVTGDNPEPVIIVKHTSSGNEQPLPAASSRTDLAAELHGELNEDQIATAQSPGQKSSKASIIETTARVVAIPRFAAGTAQTRENTVAETGSFGLREFRSTSSAAALDESKPASSSSGQVRRSSPRFETAQTHLPTTSEDVVFSLPRQPSFVTNSPSGRKRQRMIDITQHPSPRKSDSDVDIDRAMEAVVDREFELDTSSPISPQRRIKRRRLRELKANVEIEKGTPLLPNLPECVLPKRNNSYDTAVEDVSAPDQAEPDCNDPSQTSPGVMRPLLRSTNIKYQLAAPTQKPFLERVSARRTRARDSIFDVQVSPGKSGTAVPGRSTAKPQSPPATMPNRKVRALISATGLTSATQTSRPIRRRRPGSVPSPNEDPDPLAIDVSDTNSPTSITPPADVIAPNQVLACFNGKTRAYYPATCLGIAGSDSLRYQIQWEGFGADETDARGVRRMDLRIGDCVKVNLDGFPKVSHVIRGFKNKVFPSGKGVPMTDIRGYSILLLAPKQRKSLPAALQSETVKEVPISAIYLDSNMWSQMKGREYEYISQQPASVLDFATSPERPSTPATPSSRSRRNVTAYTNAGPAEPGGIFTGMAFAISYDEVRKSSLTHLIRINGGMVLQDGFHELFASDGITPKPNYGALGFTALIADRHSRKEKYMQALALNLPCLSGRWIESCLAKDAVIDWQPYLLPAGESAVLDGAIRSRILPAISEPSNANMTEITEMRSRLLDDSAVIFVTGRGKVEEKRKPFVFLTQAMGAGRIEKVVDLKAAKALLNGDDSPIKTFKWVFVDDSQLVSAKAMLEGGEQGEAADRVRVVGNEFICQSLILGGLVED